MSNKSINTFLSNASKINKDKDIILEVNIEDEFVKYAKFKKCIAFKLLILGKRGFPDRTILIENAGIFFIEFKRKNESLNPTQITVKRILEKFGFEYYICNKPGQAEKILDDFISRHKNEMAT